MYAENLDSIFSKAVKHQTLFTNHQALQSDFVPDHLPFRNQQIINIGEVLAPILHRSKPSNLLIYGKTGTGKTAVTKYVVSRLEAASKKQSINSKFIYCNTRLSGTEYRTLAELGSGIGLKIPFTGLAMSEVLSRIQQHISENSLLVILILDEIDYLVRTTGDDILYGLTTSTESLKPGSISMIGISNDLKFKEDLGARVVSRLSEEEMVFPPYSVQELKLILTERAKLAFRETTYDLAAINLCAALSGSEHGDARRAVDLLRVAGEVAEREGMVQLSEKHVRTALQKIDQDRITEALTTLPLHAKLVLIATLHSTNDQQAPLSGQVYDHYHQLCSKTNVDPLTTRRVSGLLTELDTLGLITATVVNYGRYGRTKKIIPQVTSSIISQAFNQDDLIKEILR